jgi:HlyD family secretion protein
MKRTILYAILGVVLVAAVVGVFLWRSRVAGQPEEGNRSAVVERGTMLVAVSASGIIEPQARVSLDFEAPGRVAEVAAEVGDPVKAGDVLARLDTARLELQVKQSQAALALAEAQLAQIGAGPRPEEVAAAEANVRAAEAQVSAASANLDQLVVGAGDAQIAAAQADLAAAISQQKSAADTYDMVLTCFSFKLPTGEKQKICPALGAPEEQARFNLEATDKALAAAQARLDELLAGADADEVRASRSNVLAAAAQRDATQAQLDILVAGATDEQIADAEAQVTQAQAALNEAVLALERATLLAPFDGVVAGVNVTAGEIASSGLPPITLVDTSRFRVIASLDEIDIGLLNEGLAAEVTVDALPDVVVAGTVERIAPVATPEGGVVYYEVTIGLAPIDAPLRGDMTANVTIRVDELGDVLTIPTWVVRVDRTTGQTYVHRPAGDDFERVDVELGVRYGGRAQVLSGLSEGDEVFWVESTSFGFGGREG